jgi:GTPase SAR1 family protein
MGGCHSAVGDPIGGDRSSEIEAALKAERENSGQCIKLLLLGSGECGKSTILKQMKILHNGGFSEEEKSSYHEIILKNLLTSIQTLIRAAQSFDMAFRYVTSNHHAQLLLATDALFPSEEHQTAIRQLWSEEDTIQKVFSRQSEYTLLDSAPYFLDNAARILTPGYQPSDQDILRSRLPTVGIIETDFVVDAASGKGGKDESKGAKLRFKFVDVGGQRGERKKWIHCFEDVRSILFIASLNEYDQMLAEDRSKNRLQESLQLFEGLLSLPWFKGAPIILFLNKHDLFKQKVLHSDLGAYFPQYVGGHSYEEALFFIKESFFARNRDPNKTIYAHCTDATDTQGMRFVWKATKHIILSNNLKQAGLM